MDKPKTIDECMVTFNKVLSPEDQVEILKMEEEDLSILHHGLGRWIRNNWGLWDVKGDLYKHMIELGFIHADDMSQTLIEEYWARMLNRPSKIQEKIEKYAKFWEESKR